MGCGTSKVKQSPQASEHRSGASSTSAATHGITASTPTTRQRSKLSRLPADSENSLVACGGNSDCDDDEPAVHPGTDDLYSHHSGRRNSSSSMPEARQAAAMEDHFAPVELPPALRSSGEDERSPRRGRQPQPTHRMVLEDHEKTDSAQAEKEYRRVLEQKREAQSMEAVLREMEEFDPIRPMDSFNVTHRGLLGRCWDRRAAELVPIAFLHALEANSSANYSSELAREGSVNTHDLVRKELRVNASGESASDVSPSSPDTAYPGMFPSRDWSALLRHQQSHGNAVGGSEATEMTNHSPLSQSPSMASNTNGVPRRSHWFSVSGVASQSVPWHSGVLGGGGGVSTGKTTPVSARPGSTATTTTTTTAIAAARGDEDMPALPSLEVLSAMPLKERIEMYGAFLVMHERFAGAKTAFAFQLSDDVDDEPDTRFLRNRNLKPSKGIQVTRWNRVEFFNPSLRTLTLAAMDASLGRYEARDQHAQMASVAAAGGQEIEAGLHAMGSAMFLDGNVSFGQHLLADIKNRSFVSGTGKPTAVNNASMGSRANSSFFHTGIPGTGATLSEGKIYTSDSAKGGLEFPEESVLCLAMAVPTSRLFWGSQFRQRQTFGSRAEDGRAPSANSVSVGALRNFPFTTAPSTTTTTNNNKGKSTPGSPVSASATPKPPIRQSAAPSYAGSPPASVRTPTVASPNSAVAPTLAAPVAMTHLVAFNISSFSASIDPFHWESLNYTRSPVDVDVSKSANRKQFGEGVITDVMYGGTLVIECNSPEAGAELERMLDTVVWSETRNLSAITQGVHKRMKHRLAERAATALGLKKSADDKDKDKSKEKEKEKEKSKSKDKDKSKGKDKTKDKEKNKGKDKDKDKASDAATVKETAQEDGANDPMRSYSYRVMRRIGGRPMRDAVELKHIAIYFGEEGVQERVLSSPGGAAATALLNSSSTGAGGGAEVTASFSRVASAWTGLETMTAVVETWGLHLLANPHFAQPIALYLQKFSGLVPVLQHTTLMSMSMGLSSIATDSGDEAEEDRFFAPELEPLSGAASPNSKVAVAKRIPKYNRFYTSLPSSPVENAVGTPPSNGLLGSSSSGPGSSRGGFGSSPPRRSPSSRSDLGASVQTQRGTAAVPPSGSRRTGEDSVSFIDCDDSCRAGRGRDPLALSSTQMRPRRGLPMTVSCETMPGTTNVSLPASDMDDEDEDDHSTVHSAHRDSLGTSFTPPTTPPMKAAPKPGGGGFPRVDTVQGSLVASASESSTQPPSSSFRCRNGSAAGIDDIPLRNLSEAQRAQFWSSGMYPTEDSFALPPARDPTLIFCAGAESDACRCDGARGAPTRAQTALHKDSDNKKAAQKAESDAAPAKTNPTNSPKESRLTSGRGVPPSRIIVKRRPSDDQAPPPQSAEAPLTSSSTAFFASTDTSPRTPVTDPPLSNRMESSLLRTLSSTLGGTAAVADGSMAHAARAAEAEAQWAMAMLEARALQVELEDMQNAVRVAQEELLAKEEAQRTLFRAFLPFTSMNRLDAVFLYLKTAIHEPDDLPHGCLYMDTPDWLSMLYAVWTSPRNHVRRVSIVYALMCKDLPKIGLLAGLLYFENSTAGLDRLTINASKLFGTAIPGADTASQSPAHSFDGRQVSMDSTSAFAAGSPLAPGNDGAASASKKDKPSSSGWLRRRLARRRDPANAANASLHGGDGDTRHSQGVDKDNEGDADDDDAEEEREAQHYQHYFLTHPQEGGPQLLHYGFGIVTPLYYVTAEQARDTLWWLLCAIAENARCAEDDSHSVSRRPSMVGGGTSEAAATGRNGTQPEPANAFTLRLAGLPHDRTHYLIPKSRSLSSLLHRRGGSRDTKPLAVGSRDWVDEEAMQLGSFLILSKNPSGFVFEDNGSPGSPLFMSGTAGSFVNDVELSADPRRRHKKGGAISTPPPTAAQSASFPGSMDSGLSSGTFARHEHNYGKRTWMHAEAKVEIRPFCHVLYHSCLPVGNAIDEEHRALDDGVTLEDISAPRVSHYHLPFNRVHNHPQYYITPERRLELLRIATKAGEASTQGSQGGLERHASLETLLLATPMNPLVFGLQSEEEERAVLLEEEGRLFRHTEDIWEVLRRSATKYNRSMTMRMTKGEASELDELGLVKRPILLER